MLINLHFFVSLLFLFSCTCSYNGTTNRAIWLVTAFRDSPFCPLSVASNIFLSSISYFPFPSLLLFFFFSPFHFLLETTTFHLLTRILPKMSTYIIIYFCYITISRSTIIENREQRFLQFNWHIRCACTIARIARKRYRRKMKRNKKKRKKNHLWRRKTKTMNL